ncbi:helix-turn-helix transcriptional regulator [Corynebacterium anserum]|uniref:WYL domain-containing protein n=1 Tax=Corynebacterium anserum TaxID=2684406 RepID=A0A7G7YNB5_9CORY|nr:WYL domain-containing protein [Corynebacterium anserum]QNH95985.1 WYL domain-containing protein [Corynebacterium anserum]
MTQDTSQTHTTSRLPAAGAQFAQSLNVLTWFHSHPHGTFMQASSQLGLSVPQIKHELQQLSYCGLPGYLPGSLVEINVNKTTASVEFTAGLDRPLTLTSMEAGVLLFNLEALRNTVDPSYHDAIDDVVSTLRSLLRDSRKYQVRREDRGLVASDSSTHNDRPLTQAEQEHDEQGALLASMRAAVTQRRLICADYHSLNSDSVTRRTWIPDRIALINGEPYLWGREDEREQRIYAIDRMRNITFGAQDSAPAPQHPVIKEEDPFNFEATSEWVTLELHKNLAWMLEYYPMWLIEEQPENDYLAVTMPNTGAWLERFCVAYSESIQVIEPLDLAKRVRERAKLGLQAYSI